MTASLLAIAWKINLPWLFLPWIELQTGKATYKIKKKNKHINQLKYSQILGDNDQPKSKGGMLFINAKTST